MAETAHTSDSAHQGAHIDRPDLLEREQFSISDLTEEFGCTARALRFYEDEGLISPARVGLRGVAARRRPHPPGPAGGPPRGDNPARARNLTVWTKGRRWALLARAMTRTGDGP